MKNVWNDALVHCFVPTIPEEITQNNSKNLEKMSFCFGDTKSKVRVNDTFDPV